MLTAVPCSRQRAVGPVPELIKPFRPLDREIPAVVVETNIGIQRDKVEIEFLFNALPARRVNEFRIQRPAG